MNTVRLLFCLAATLSLVSCSVLKPKVAQVLQDTDVVDKLTDAIADIDPQTVAKDQLCTRYRQKGVMYAERAWVHVWPDIAPIFQTPPDPAADIEYCEKLITDAGATIVTKKSDSGAASAVCFQAQFPKDFESRPIDERAAIACHEAVHILDQKTQGCANWAKLYFATITARMTFEGIAYVASWAMFERYGWSAKRAQAYIARRADGFPERYVIPRDIISDTCTLEHWTAIRAALRERAGV